MVEGYTPESVQLPLVEVHGTARECGRHLGRLWSDVICRVTNDRVGSEQWWHTQEGRDLVHRIAPHLIDLYVGMAEGAQIDHDRLVLPSPQDLPAGCTSFAVAPDAARDGHLICGQTKDTAAERTRRNVILNLSLTDAPSMLTMTYPGMLFGHGFVVGGCAIFRNSISVTPNPSKRPLPYDAWGVLALHCKSVDDVCALTDIQPISSPFHCTVCDMHGGIVGIEHADGDTAILRPQNGVYTHANNIVSHGRLRDREDADVHEAGYCRRSRHRQDRLMHLLLEQAGQSTSGSVQQSLADHDGYPHSVCNHHSKRFCTTAALVAEPTRGRMWVTSGPPCRNAPREFRCPPRSESTRLS